MDKTGGKFRKKRVNFAMVSNEIIRDETISLKAKGLYALIQSYITIEDFTLYKGFLQSKCIEGERAFDGAWKELKEKGYLVQYKMREGAKSFYYEYELLDSPLPPQNVGVENVPPQNVGVENVGIQNVQDTKCGSYNNTDSNNILNNNILSNHIISAEDVKRQISYECYTDLDRDTVDNLIMIMVDVLNMEDSEVVRVNQRTLPAALVKNRFKQINHSHIEYILLVLRDFTGKIANTRNYLITTIYNAPSTMDVYFSNRVMHDMYGT